MRDVTIAPVGDSAAIAIVGDRIDPATMQRVWALNALIGERLGLAALDIVPAYTSVLVRFDHHRTNLATVIAALRGAVDDCGDSIVLTPRRIRIGACFDDEHGADLEETARAANLKPAQFIKKLCAAQYRVAFLGYLAGFPYLMGLPPELAAPRLMTPRDRVPAGSVAIAGAQCGIYPRTAPGGWRLLGQTRAPLFDASREIAALFAPGDEVRFESVNRVENAVAEVAWS